MKSLICSDLADANHICITNTIDPNLACKELKKCLSVDSTDLSKEPDCSKYPTTEETKLICQRDGIDKCKEIYFCDQAPNDAEGDCSSFITSDANHACVSS